MDAVLVVFGRHQQDRKVKVADKPGMSVGAQEGNHFFFNSVCHLTMCSAYTDHAIYVYTKLYSPRNPFKYKTKYELTAHIRALPLVLVKYVKYRFTEPSGLFRTVCRWCSLFALYLFSPALNYVR